MCSYLHTFRHLRFCSNLQELQVFMDRANTGFVYFNYGTLMDPKYLPNSSLTIMFDVLGRLEQKVIFKWKKNETQGLPDNFYVDSWLPQREILSKNFKVNNI